MNTNYNPSFDTEEYPKYFARNDGALWTDNCAFVRCDGPNHAAGIMPDLSVGWEYNDGSWTERHYKRFFHRTIDQVSLAVALQIALANNLGANTK